MGVNVVKLHLFRAKGISIALDFMQYFKIPLPKVPAISGEFFRVREGFPFLGEV